MKAKVASGTEGVSTKLPEYELTLSVSKKLKRILEERGYQVVMIRESNDVNLSNAERAEIANKSGASIFVRFMAIRWITRRSTEHSPCADGDQPVQRRASRGKLFSFQEDHGLCLRGNRLQEPRCAGDRQHERHQLV